MAWMPTVSKGFSAREFYSYVHGLTFGVWRPQFAVLHHTGSPTLAQWQQAGGEAMLERLTVHYRDTLKWRAGPHLFIADDQIWVFNPLTSSGLHSASWNHVSWGLMLVGDFHKEPFDSGPGLAVRTNAVEALCALHTFAGLDPQTLRFHKEDPESNREDCPGWRVNKRDLLKLVSKRVAELYAGEHDPTVTVA